LKCQRQAPRGKGGTRQVLDAWYLEKSKLNEDEQIKIVCLKSYYSILNTLERSIKKI
jgi:hypothetical protein